MKLSLFKKLIVTATFLGVLTFPLQSSAQATSLIAIPFGGYLTVPTTCTCPYNPGTVFVVYDFVTKSPITLFYSPIYSRLNSWYNFITPGVMFLGTYYIGGVCLNTSTGSDCEPGPVQPIGTITPWGMSGFGTSLEPTSGAI